jgi:putative CocE/NonD family hydrolase
MEGYAIVYQDCRGTGESEGIFDPLTSEADDGVDTVDWIRRQAWCDGNIGTFGHSYLGFTQWATASRAPVGLKANTVQLVNKDGAFRRLGGLWMALVVCAFGGPFEDFAFDDAGV